MVLTQGAFRGQAAAKIESPEQLDTRIKPAKPAAWVAVVAVLIGLVVALTWSIVSVLPTTVQGTGFFLPKGGWTSAQATASGIVTVLDVSVNDPVVAGEALALIQESSGGSMTVRAPTTGYAVEVGVSQQEYVTAGTQMVVIRPLDDTLVVHAYIPTGEAHEVSVGARAQVAPNSVSSSAYGYLEGRVTSVAPFPATQQRLQEVLQNEALVRSVSESGPVTEITVALRPADTPTGYKWSIGKGPEGDLLTGGVPAEVSVVTGTRHPISYIVS